MEITMLVLTVLGAFGAIGVCTALIYGWCWLMYESWTNREVFAFLLFSSGGLLGISLAARQIIICIRG